MNRSQRRRVSATLISAGGRTAYPLPTVHNDMPDRPVAPVAPFYRLDKYVFEGDEEQPDDGLLPDEGEEENPLAPGMPGADEPGGDTPWVVPFDWIYRATPMGV